MSKPDARKKHAPLTAHPLFPAVVALWSAALFGLGSAVVLVATLGHALSRPALLPVLSGAIALIAAALGYALTRKYLSPAPPVEIIVEPAPRRREEDIIRRPVVASVELGEPILGNEDDADAVLAEDIEPAPSSPVDGEWTEVVEEPVSAEELSQEEIADEEAEESEEDAVVPSDAELANESLESEAADEEDDGGVLDTDDDEGALQPVAEMQQRVSEAFNAAQPETQGDETAESETSQSPPEQAPVEAQAPETEPEPVAEARPGKAKRQTHLSTAPLQELGMVELVERLGLSMRRLRSSKQAPESAPSPAKSKAEVGKPTENIAPPSATVSVLHPKPQEIDDSEGFDGDDEAILSNGSAAEVALRDALATLRKTRGLA